MGAVAAEPLFADHRGPVDVGFASPTRQSRMTVAFRVLLALPHVVVLWELALVGVPLLVVGWLAALVLGRLPRWIARYQAGVIAYSTRVHAYAYLLADRFPPFGFSADEYSIAVKIGASRLSRLKILFRWLLMIPAAVVAGIAAMGLLVLSPVIWLVTLVLGRMPQPLFTAVAGVIRYQARYGAYVSLVTDEYPQRVFGDAASDWATEGFRLSRSGASEWISGAIIVLGIAGTIASVVLRDDLGKPPPPNPALVSAEGRFDRAVDRSFTLDGCKLQCETAHERAFGEAFERFGSDLVRIPFPVSQHRRVSILIGEMQRTGRILIAVSKSKDGGRAQGIDPASPAVSVDSVLEDITAVLGPSYRGYLG